MWEFKQQIKDLHPRNIAPHNYLSNLYMRFEARPDSPLRERGKVY